MTPHQNALVSFAMATLEILEEDKDWGAETLDAIAASAFAWKLAYPQGDECLFTVKSPAVPRMQTVKDLDLTLLGALKALLADLEDAGEDRNEDGEVYAACKAARKAINQAEGR